jgi:tRNA A-37 threonylcarbamoyl transferase component Bud32
MPSFDGATDWLGDPLPDAVEAQGRTTLVHFWSVSCGICRESLTRVAEWREKDRHRGLGVILIHMPRYEEDTDREAVRTVLSELNINEPCGIDNQHKLRDAFRNDDGVVPAYYLFDAERKLRVFAAGERGLDVISATLERLTLIKTMPLQCARCGKVLAKGARFCTKCGAGVDGERAAGLDPRTEIAPPKQPAEVRTLPSSELLVGLVLESKYRLLACLGNGGMGAVYRAKREHIGDEVAVKLLHRKYVTEPAAIERFRREACAAARLHHPNVVTIHDFGDAKSDLEPAFIVMELVAGETLRDILAREGRLSVERATRLMNDICAGVGAAHRNDIVHRDLKPDNIMIVGPDCNGDRETTKVVDFGIAKLRDLAGESKLTQTGSVMGTPHYMSPEQCRGESLDARSDVYSLGAMMYEMLTGAPPFVSRSIAGLLAKHLTEPAPPLPASLDVPPAVRQAISRALSKKPGQRQSSATEFARELQTRPEKEAGATS